MKSKALTPQRASPSVLPPTPWQAEGTTPHIAHILAVEPDGETTLVGVVIDNIGPDGRALRWAELMAAAPDLADACEAMVAFWQRGECSVPEILARCTAALAKARGEGPP